MSSQIPAFGIWHVNHASRLLHIRHLGSHILPYPEPKAGHEMPEPAVSVISAPMKSYWGIGISVIKQENQVLSATIFFCVLAARWKRDFYSLLGFYAITRVSLRGDGRLEFSCSGPTNKQGLDIYLRKRTGKGT